MPHITPAAVTPFQTKGKDRTVASESVPTERIDVAGANLLRAASVAHPAAATASASAEDVPWTVDEQKALEAALRAVPKDDPDRFSKVVHVTCTRQCQRYQSGGCAGAGAQQGRVREAVQGRCRITHSSTFTLRLQELRDKIAAKKGS